MSFIQTIENDIYHLSYVTIDQTLYFKAIEVASILEYKDTDQTVRLRVDNEDKVTFDRLLQLMNPVVDTGYNYTERKQTIYINISGLFSLILGSKKPEAKLFKKWVTSEVLPSIMSKGSYNINDTLSIDEGPQMSM